MPTLPGICGCSGKEDFGALAGHQGMSKNSTNSSHWLLWRLNGSLKAGTD